MKKKYILPVILALFIGYLCADYVLYQYDSSNSLAKTPIYFLEIKDNNIELSNKLTVKQDNETYTYIGITSNSDIALKIKKLYKDNNIDLLIKNMYIDNNSFLLELEQYDILLENTNTFEEINSILKTVLATYEERVLNK